MLVHGCVMTTLGSVLPPLIERFDMDKASAGALFSLLGLGVLSGSIAFGPIVDRYGFKMLFIVCAALIVAGLEGIAYAGNMTALRAAIVLIGLGGGALNGGTNAVVADISEGARGAGLSLLGVFFGIGASGVPFLTGILLKSFSYSTLVAGIGGFVLLPTVFFFSVRFPAAKQPQGFPLHEGLRLLRAPFLWLIGLLMFIQSGIETTIAGWITSFLGEELAMRPDTAAFYLAIFWVSMIAARLLLGWLLRKASPSLVWRAFLGVALFGSLMLLFAPGAELAAMALFVTGFGLAASFPVALGFTGDRYPALSGTAFSIVFVMAMIGGSVLPYMVGLIGQSSGLRLSFFIVPAGIIIMVALISATTRTLLREKPLTESV